jgi:ATP phosphoribosyltransferase regulatory subunit
VGNVLRTRPDAFAGSRELLQLGAELFGHPGPESDIEVARLMLAALASAGLRDLHLDLGHVGVFRALAAEARLPEELETDLFDALQRKARSRIEALLAQCDAPAGIKAMLAVLVDLNGGPDTLIRARELLKGAPPAVQVALINLERVADAVTSPATPVYIDLAELRGYRYYTGVVFSAFVSGQGQAVAQGGRYDGIGRAFGRARAATGFSTDLRRLLRLAPADDAGLHGILVPHTGAKGLDETIATLRAAGERVVARLPGDTSTARVFGCDRELVEQGGQWVVKPA